MRGKQNASKSSKEGAASKEAQDWALKRHEAIVKAEALREEQRRKRSVQKSQSLGKIRHQEDGTNERTAHEVPAQAVRRHDPMRDKPESPWATEGTPSIATPSRKTDPMRNKQSSPWATTDENSHRAHPTNDSEAIRKHDPMRDKQESPWATHEKGEPTSPAEQSCVNISLC